MPIQPFTLKVEAFIRKHPNKFTRKQLFERFKCSRARLDGIIKSRGLADIVLPESSLRTSNPEERPMTTKQQQMALLEECQKHGIDVSDVKHFWHKSKRISMFVVAQNRPTYEKIRLQHIKEMKKYSPKYPDIKRDKVKEGHLLIADASDIHVGKYAASDETGFSYNMEMAVRAAQEGVEGVVQKANGFPIDKILFPIGNDVLHTDNPFRTTTAGTKQDTDGMWWEHYSAARGMYTHIIENLRQVAPVHCVFCPSNHDYMSGYMLADALACWFNNAKDVTFDNTINHRKVMKYGKSMICTTHGDGAKDADMPLLMATEFPQMWAETKYRYIYQGHVHHTNKIMWLGTKDRPGATLITLRSPSATDGWHHRNGYVGVPQAVEGFVHSKLDGQVAHITHNL